MSNGYRTLRYGGVGALLTGDVLSGGGNFIKYGRIVWTGTFVALELLYFGEKIPLESLKSST